MKNIIKPMLTVVAVALVAGCSNGSAVVLTPPKPTTGGAALQYTQIERLSNPAVKEVFESFQDHQKSNAVEPYADPTIQADILGTEDYVRPPNTTLGSDYGKVLQSVLYPDEMAVNLSGSAPSASNADPYFFLSTVADGASYFGGRAPNDDVIGLELGVLFGHTLPALKVQPEDNEENDCISAQNLSATTVPTTNSFPYLPSPH